MFAVCSEITSVTFFCVLESNEMHQNNAANKSQSTQESLVMHNVGARRKYKGHHTI